MNLRGRDSAVLESIRPKIARSSLICRVSEHHWLMTVRICHKMQSLPLFFLDWGRNNQRDFAQFLSLIKSVALKMLPIWFCYLCSTKCWRTLSSFVQVILNSTVINTKTRKYIFQFNLNSFESFVMFFFFKVKQ